MHNSDLKWQTQRIDYSLVDELPRALRCSGRSRPRRPTVSNCYLTVCWGLRGGRIAPSLRSTRAPIVWRIPLFEDRRWSVTVSPTFVKKMLIHVCFVILLYIIEICDEGFTYSGLGPSWITTIFAPDFSWSCLIVSPPFPMIKPTLAPGIIISSWN